MAKIRTNRPELDELPDSKRAAILSGADAIKEIADFRRRTFDKWMEVARGLVVLRELADQRSSRKAFKNLRRDHGYGSLNEATCTRLILMAKHETAIRIWRDSLTDRQRESWNSPTSICQRCPAVRADMAKAPPRASRKPNRSALEPALDIVHDCLEEMDADNRRAVLERIAAWYGLRIASDVRAPKRKQASAEAEPPVSQPRTGALNWDLNWDGGIADTENGRYHVQGLRRYRRPFQYAAAFETGKDKRDLGTFKTFDEATAACEHDAHQPASGKTNALTRGEVERSARESHGVVRTAGG
jgi:hypothetical protein